MNANYLSAEQAREMSDEVLVNRFFAVCVAHCEMDCSEAVETLRQELLRRLQLSTERVKALRELEKENTALRERLEGMRGERDAERLISKEWEQKYEKLEEDFRDFKQKVHWGE